MKLKSALLGASALVAMVGTAVAADLPVKAPYINQQTSVFSWTGFYLGVNGGYGFAAQDIGLSGTPVARLQEPGTIGTNASGGVGGIHAGFNYQISPTWVWGVEGRFAGTGIKSAGTDPNGNTLTTSLPWESSVVARLGVVPADPRLMLYGLGGVAFGDIKQSVGGPNIASALTPATDNIHTGWTAGAGIEYAFTNNLIGGLEYRYTNLGNTAIALCSVNGGCAVSNINVSQTAAWNEFLGRLSVKF